jgi:segregation and condensation protein A
VRLPIFEGPLDLLLHLIKRNEVPVTDIPIATITDQYLATLDERPELNLDGAGEYLVMAATLIYIKSRMLLPAPDDEETEEDPRTELVQQLVEYQRYREVAIALGQRAVLARDVFAGSGEPGAGAGAGDTPPVRDASLGDLLAAFREVLRRLEPPPAHEIPREEFSIRQAVAAILARFEVAAQVDFASLFAAGAHRATVIGTFLALLELIRVRVVAARQPDRFGPITLELRVATVAEASERVRDIGDDAGFTRGGEEEFDGNGTAPDREPSGQR